MKHAIILLLLYIAAVFETSAVQPWLVADVAPRFLLLVAMIAFFTFNNWRAITWVAASGLVSDALQPHSTPLGIEMILACSLAVIYQKTTLKDDEQQSLFLMTLLCVGFVFFVNAMAEMLRGTVGGQVTNIVTIIEWSLWSSLYSAILFLAGLMIVRRIKALAPLSRRRDSTELTNQWKMLT